MKALSIRQPWAWAVAVGVKDVENRDNLRNFRGEFAVHAGQQFDEAGYVWIQTHAAELGIARNPSEARAKQQPLLPERSDFPCGGIVGFATAVDCVEASESRWFFGRYGFVLASARSCALIPMAGKLSFFEVGDMPRKAAMNEGGKTDEDT